MELVLYSLNPILPSPPLLPSHCSFSPVFVDVQVPTGLPRFSLPDHAFSDVSDLGDVIAACVPVALVAFMSQWSVARKYADKTNQVDLLDPNQEAFALGRHREKEGGEGGGLRVEQGSQVHGRGGGVDSCARP